MVHISPDMQVSDFSEPCRGCVSLGMWTRATQSSHDGAGVAVAVDAATAYSPYIPGAIRYSVNSVPEILDELNNRAYRGLANLVDYTGLVRVSAPSPLLPDDESIDTPCHMVLMNRLGKLCMGLWAGCRATVLHASCCARAACGTCERCGAHCIDFPRSAGLVRRLMTLCNRPGPHLLQDV